MVGGAGWAAVHTHPSAPAAGEDASVGALPRGDLRALAVLRRSLLPPDVNRTVHHHHSNKITPEQLNRYDCPIQLVCHGDVPHIVLEHHSK